MSKMDLSTKIDVMSEHVPEEDGFHLVEWNIRPNAASTNLDSELDNSCGCDCGCGCNLDSV